MNIEKLIKDLKSWKTTVLGIISGLMIILPQIQNLLDGDPETVFSETILMTGFALMGLGIASKDGDKTSKELGLDEGD